MDQFIKERLEQAMKESRTYVMRAQVRDKNGKMLVKANDFSLDEIRLEDLHVKPDALERQMKIIAQQFEALAPDMIVDLTASCFDSISNTLPCHASYYGKEKRFVKH